MIGVIREKLLLCERVGMSVLIIDVTERGE